MTLAQVFLSLASSGIGSVTGEEVSVGTDVILSSLSLTLPPWGVGTGLDSGGNVEVSQGSTTTASLIRDYEIMDSSSVFSSFLHLFSIFFGTRTPFGKR